MAVKKVISVSSSKSSAAKVDAAASTEAAVKVTANPRLVSLLRSYDDHKSKAQSYLIEAAALAQKEQLTKEEIIASIMEARDLNRKTAGEQFSRMKPYLLKPEVLEDLRGGKITLKEARLKVAGDKKKKVLSTSQVQKNAEATILTSITRMLKSAKEAGISLTDLISTLKEAAKKAGVK